MSSFTAVVSGNPTRATDVNQVITALNGASNSQLALVNSPGNNMLPLAYSSAPASDSQGVGISVTGDTSNRIALYVRGADGYGGVMGGAGGTSTAHLHTNSSGWVIDESLSVSANLTISGSCSLASFNTSGNGTLGGNLTVTGTVTTNILQLGRGLLRQIGTFSGSGAGTYTHGCGIIPDWIGITENTTNSTMTVGVDSIGGTTVHVNVGVGGTSWIAVAFVTH